MAVGKFLNPRNDLVFKKIFGTEKNKEILIHFLNDILDRESSIKEVTFLKTIQDPEVAYLRVSIVDVMCQDEKGNRFIIEMQLSHEKGFDKRSLYYAARAYCSQRTEGTVFDDLKEVYFLAITDFIPFPKKKKWLSRIGLKDLETNEHDIGGIHLLFLQLPLFDKNKDDLKTMTSREKWAYFLKYADDTEEQELEGLTCEDAAILRAYEELNRFGWTEKALNDYESVEMKRAADKGILKAAIETGKAQGLEEGLARGKVEGLEEGLARGKAEGLGKGMEKERNNVILAMLEKNLPIDQIAEITGTAVDEIVKLQENAKSSV